ncbi:MAG TPA: hypothetical protein VEU08_12885, partial [Vicinamibacterales bacterium]|nr:hypothetical protein [Vicinamibacterales bacterium]
GYSQFEQRARRRRVDRRLDAARSAIARKRLREAAAALDEVIELDPNLPELAGLTASFDDLRRTLKTPHRGRWIAAAGAFAATLLAATLVEHARPSLLSHSTTAVADLVEPPQSVPPSIPSSTPDDVSDSTALADAARVESALPPVATALPISRTVATSGALERDAIRTPPPPSEPERSAPAVEPRSESVPPVVPPPASAPQATAPATTASAVPLVEAAPVNLTPALRASSDPIPIPPSPPNDDQLVRQALQRYRSAYEELDAPSARAVYPAINEAALARAFDGLRSQTLTFDACEVQVPATPPTRPAGEPRAT